MVTSHGEKPLLVFSVMVGVVNELHMNIISLHLYSSSTLDTGPEQVKAVQYTLHSTLLATQNHFDTKA